MPDLRERVARAICEAVGQENAKQFFADYPVGAILYRTQADAAIASLLAELAEPTPEMVNKAQLQYYANANPSSSGAGMRAAIRAIAAHLETENGRK